MAIMTNQNHGSNNKTWDVFDSNDDIWNDYNSLGASYKKLVDPYMKYSYQQGLLDRVGNWLGFKTGEDNYRMQMQDRARLAIAEQLDNQFQNNYNSQASQAARQRDAGLNPDLAGEATGDPAGQASQPLPLINQDDYAKPEGLFTDLASLIGIATGGLESVATFRSLLAGASKSREEASDIRFKTMKDAYDYAGTYLTAFDPDDRRDYEITPDVYDNEIVESRIQAVDSRFSYLPKKERQMLKFALNARRHDPRLYDDYYKNRNSAVLNRGEVKTNEKVFGSLDVVDEVVQAQNHISYRYLVDTAKARLRANKILADYNVSKYSNDFDFEEFKRKYGLPELMVEDDLMQHVSNIFKADYDIAKSQASKDWLNYLDRLRKKKDPASVWLFNALIQGGYAPLLNKSVSGGAFGVNGAGSWTNFPIPGSGGGLDIIPKEGTNKGVGWGSPEDYNWLDNKL